MKIYWLGHAAFKIQTKSGKIIYLDPYKLSKDMEKADIIVTSHSHGDHFSRGDIKKLVRENTVVIGPKSISSDLEKFNGKALDIGESIDIDGIKIELVPAYTIKRGTHPIENKWTGSIIETEGKKLYHAGDTERIPEMKELASKGINVALLPCGGTYTMDFEESCNAALDINPDIVVPMHNWGKDLIPYKELLEKKNPKIRVEILEKKSLEL